MEGAAVDAIERVERATAFGSEKVAGVSADDLGKGTPCAEFDVRALLNHMIGGLGMLSVAASGGKPVMPDGDQFGANPGDDYRKGREALLAALRDEGAIDRDWELPFGTIPGSTMVGIAFMEHVTHGWDVAKATGQDASIPPELVTECMEVVVPMDAMLRIPGVCGPAIDVPDNASAQDKLIAFLGRQP
jgi:uncharacterized protein (TIGR03086 family)